METTAQPNGGAPATAEVPLDRQLEQAKSQAAEYLDGWQRARAELSNYKKRQEREREEMMQLSNARLINRILPVLDDFDRAFQTRPQGIDHLTWIEGLFLIQRKLQMILEAEGVKEIDALGQPFDPTQHEAIGQVEATADKPADQVAEVLQKGYKLGNRVLRPVLVKVSR
jgi:molecular chaperone GrpE